MRMSQEGRALLKRFEGLRLECYRCDAGRLTVGYGSTGPHVREGMRISEAEAEALFDRDLARFEAGVEKMLPGLPQRRFDALVSFAFNLGLKALESSRLVRKARAGDWAGAAKEFDLWVHVGARPSRGLMLRRAAERALFESA